jgi:DNA-directed RNA polymerase I and III subunit RPAC2
MLKSIISTSSKISSADKNQESSKTFVLQDADHTLLNPVRYMTLKNSKVDFCGYSIPHPSDSIANLRVQCSPLDQEYKAETALEKSLNDLIDCCNIVLNTFESNLNEAEK